MQQSIFSDCELIFTCASGINVLMLFDQDGQQLRFASKQPYFTNSYIAVHSESYELIDGGKQLGVELAGKTIGKYGYWWLPAKCIISRLNSTGTSYIILPRNHMATTLRRKIRTMQKMHKSQNIKRVAVIEGKKVDFHEVGKDLSERLKSIVKNMDAAPGDSFHVDRRGFGLTKTTKRYGKREHLEQYCYINGRKVFLGDYGLGADCDEAQRKKDSLQMESLYQQLVTNRGRFCALRCNSGHSDPLALLDWIDYGKKQLSLDTYMSPCDDEGNYDLKGSTEDDLHFHFRICDPHLVERVGGLLNNIKGKLFEQHDESSVLHNSNKAKVGTLESILLGREQGQERERQAVSAEPALAS